MATNTYVALDKVTVSGSTTNTVTFSSIPSTYTDLVIIANGYTLTTDISQRIRFNSDSATNYSLTYVGGNGTSASSGRTTSGTGIYANYLTGWSSTSTQPGNWIFSVMNYANSTTYKTTLSRANQPTGGSYPGTEALVGLWRSTAAITSLTIEAGYSSSHYFAAGTTLSLYGIKAAGANPANTAKATGGTITYTDTDVVHTFTSSGTFTPSVALSCEYLVVAGGGGSGGGRSGGGGGAGGFLTGTLLSIPASAQTITVGSGGSGGSSGGNTSNGTNGTNSSIASLISSLGGGYGKGTGVSGVAAGSGGSGGGANEQPPGGSGTAGQGNNGGYGFTSGTDCGGGGGGAGANGANGILNGLAGNGGAGLGSGISGTFTYYAGGGAGGRDDRTGGWATGGIGGGGDGGTDNRLPTVGTANTGGGGGGSGDYSPAAGKAGGSGVVIIRYAK